MQATADMFDAPEEPEDPKEFVARALYPAVFDEVDSLRLQVDDLKIKLAQQALSTPSSKSKKAMMSVGF